MKLDWQSNGIISIFIEQRILRTGAGFKRLGMPCVSKPIS